MPTVASQRRKRRWVIRGICVHVSDNRTVFGQLSHEVLRRGRKTMTDPHARKPLEAIAWEQLTECLWRRGCVSTFQVFREEWLAVLRRFHFTVCLLVSSV